MSIVEVRVPTFGMSGTEVEIIEISISVGDQVEVGSTVVEAASDKVDFAIESDATGTVEEILCAVGDMKSMGDVLLTVATAQ